MVYISNPIGYTLFVDYSYGVVLWEMLTREVPYKGIPNPAIAQQVLNRTLSLTVRDLYPVSIRTIMESKYDLFIFFISALHLF